MGHMITWPRSKTLAHRFELPAAIPSPTVRTFWPGPGWSATKDKRKKLLCTQWCYSISVRPGAARPNFLSSFLAMLSLSVSWPAMESKFESRPPTVSKGGRANGGARCRVRISGCVGGFIADEYKGCHGGGPREVREGVGWGEVGSYARPNVRLVMH
jgi:hypothetical protein